MANPERLYPEGAAPPWMLHSDAAEEYTCWSRQVAKGGHLGLPWHAVHGIVGPLVRGWLVLVGARAKGGKSTLLRSIFDCWVTDFGKRILYVGTEQNAGILRALWACIRLRLPTEAAIDPTHPEHHRILSDVASGQAQNGLADRAIIVAEPDITLESFTGWARLAFRENCDVLMFDHFHRLEDDGTSQNRSRNAAVRHIKNIASKSNMLILVAAQLKNGDGGLLGEYEVPGSHSWAETAGLRREADVAIQAWRPFKVGVTRQQKAEAKDDAAKITELVQPNAMAIRCDAHRYRDVATYRAARLQVKEGEITSWSHREYP